MPGTITTDFTIVDNADNTTVSFLSLGTFASALVANTDMNIQGANAYVGRVSANSAWGLGAATAGNDMTTGNHVFVWLKNVTWPGTDTRANGGLRICISSDATPTLTGTTPSNGPTNSKSWYVGGSDVNATEGWVCYVVDPNSTSDLLLGAPILTSIKRYGSAFKITSTIGSGSFKPDNALFDLIKFGTGLTINNGTSTSPVAFIDIYNADSSSTNEYGVLTRQNGIYFGSGKLKFGTSAQTAVTFFSDTSQVLVFQPFPVANSFYSLVTAGASGFTTTLQLGTFINSVASGGCTISGAIGTGIGAPGAPTGAAATGTGLNIGNYLYKITFVTSVGETNGGAESATVTTTTGNQRVSLTAIPTYTTTERVIARNIYRTKVGGASGTELFVATIADNTTTTFTDSTADTALGRPVPTVDTTVSSAWTLTANAANTVTNLYGCNLSQMRPSTLNSSSAMQSCVISNSGEITTNGATINKCTFSNVQQQTPVGGTWALIFSATGDATAVTNCNFVNCNKAIKITTAGTYTFSNLQFSGNTFDVENASTGLVTINATNGTNVSTHIETNGGTTVINNAVTLTVTVQTSNGTAIQNARVAIYKTGNIVAGQELVNALTNSSGIVTTSYVYAGNQNIVVRVRAETPTISTPVFSSFSTASTGGSLAGNTTYYYRVSALNDLGETLAFAEQSKLTSTGTSTNTITINWGAVTDAVSYNVYGRTTGAEQLIANTTSTSYTDTGSITPSGSLPASNTTGTTRYINVDSNGVITSTGYSALFTMVLDTIASSIAI